VDDLTALVFAKASTNSDAARDDRTSTSSGVKRGARAA
jgi:hypothetical protein